MSITTEWVAVSAGGGGQVMILRVARLARLTRSLRLIMKFRNLWLLLQGLIASLNTLVYTVVLIVVMLSVFGTVGVELITLRARDTGDFDSDPVVIDIIDHYFSSLPVTMLTLVQFICMDDIAIIYTPLVRMDWVLAIYFFLVIGILAIVLMNIITAILVNGAMEQTDNDKEARRILLEQTKRKMLKSLRAMFLRLDGDGSGSVEKTEILDMSGADRQILNDFMNAVADPFEIFDLLDINGAGSLDVDEFCEGLYQAATSNVPLELRRIDKRVDALVKFVHVSQESLAHKLALIETHVVNSRCTSRLPSKRARDEADPSKQAASALPQCLSSNDNKASFSNGNGQAAEVDEFSEFIQRMKVDLEASIRRHQATIHSRLEHEPAGIEANMPGLQGRSRGAPNNDAVQERDAARQTREASCENALGNHLVCGSHREISTANARTMGTGILVTRSSSDEDEMTPCSNASTISRPGLYMEASTASVIVI